MITDLLEVIGELYEVVRGARIGHQQEDLMGRGGRGERRVRERGGQGEGGRGQGERRVRGERGARGKGREGARGKGREGSREKGREGGWCQSMVVWWWVWLAM